MKKLTLPPLFIVIASALYFLLVSVALAQEPVTESKQDNKLVKYCVSDASGANTITTSEGTQVNEPIALQNGAIVSLEGIITWKDGSKTTLHNGDCVGVDINGAVYVAKAPAQTEKSNSGITSHR